MDEVKSTIPAVSPEGTEPKERKKEGKFNEQVRLNILISDDLDKELDRICAKLDWTKTKAVGEAIVMWVNSLRERGV